MFGPCMCGDTCCPSCGPAQGNYRCPSCNGWISEGCDCTEEEIKEATVRQNEEDEAYARAMQEDYFLSEEDKQALNSYKYEVREDLTNLG